METQTTKEQDKLRKFVKINPREIFDFQLFTKINFHEIQEEFFRKFQISYFFCESQNEQRMNRYSKFAIISPEVFKDKKVAKINPREMQKNDLRKKILAKINPGKNLSI